MLYFKNKVKLINSLNFLCRLDIKLLHKMSWKVKDNQLFTFTQICDEIGEESSYLKKAQILQDFLKKGTNKKEFQGDIVLWVRMLIPSDSQRVYNLQNNKMLKLFSRLFNQDAHKMQLDLEQEGDVSVTISKFFKKSTTKVKPAEESSLYLQDVEEFLQKLEQRGKEEEQTDLLRDLSKQCTENDLRSVIRIIKKDLGIHAKASHILAAFGNDAFSSYQATRDLEAVVKQYAFKDAKGTKKKEAAPAKGAKGKKGKVNLVQVMTPISPMLANACNSVEEAFKKSPSGLFSEVKYDGERVQIHKQGNEFKFFSRNLKPVMDHKVKRFKEFIPKAFPGSGDMILDSEIILVNTKTGELLPFGSLGAHKKKEYTHAEVCLFVFDCILYKGEDLTNLTTRERRQILEDNITPVKNYVQLSESHFLKTKSELSLMTAKVLKANLEGVVLKDPSSTYQPGKRGWLKVKKDYLFGGKMADTADLVVLGASYGSGKIGGQLSIFLMGTYDKRDRLWKTVTKVHTGLDDSTRADMHKKLMALMERSDPKNLPNWLLCSKSLIPDFIALDPLDMPVWEITGAEFTKSNEHTASGISIRFPRITKLRDDKSAEQVNDLEHLENMYKASKDNVNVDLLIKGCDEDDLNESNLKIESKLILNQTKKEKIEDDEADEEEAVAEKSPSKSKKEIKKEAAKTPTKAGSIANFFKRGTPNDSKLKDNKSPKKEKREENEVDEEEKKKPEEQEKPEEKKKPEEKEKPEEKQKSKISPKKEKKQIKKVVEEEEEEKEEQETEDIAKDKTDKDESPSKSEKDNEMKKENKTPPSAKNSRKSIKRDRSGDESDKSAKKPKKVETESKDGKKQRTLDFFLKPLANKKT